MKGVKLCTLCITNLFAGLIFASSFDAGASFLMIQPSPRSTAMAGAFSSIADDASANYYNPAGLGFIKYPSIMFVHTPWLRSAVPGINHEFLAFTYPLPVGTIGANIIYLNYGKVYGYYNGQYLGSWSPYDLQVQLSYGSNVTPDLSLGGSVKFIHSFLAPENIISDITGVNGSGSGMTFAVGFGLLYKKAIKLGEGNVGEIGYSLCFDNLGPAMTITSISEKQLLPYNVRTGISFIPLNLKNHRLTMAFELTKVLVNIMKDYKENGPKYIFDDTWKQIGLEYVLYDVAFMRLGYFYDKLGMRSGLTYGIGIKVFNFSFDISDDHSLYEMASGFNLRFGLSYNFKLQ